MNLRRTIFGAIAVAVLMALAMPQETVAQIWEEYALSIQPRPYRPITSLGGAPVRIAPENFVNLFAPTQVDSNDGVAGPINIGFPFEYNGQVYTRVYVSINGWISFEEPGAAFFTADPTTLFNSSRPNQTVAPFFGDHYLRRGGNVDSSGRTFVPGTIRRVTIPGTRDMNGVQTSPDTFVVEWEDLNINYRFDPTRPDDPFAPVANVQDQASSVATFQVWLIQAPIGSPSQQGDIEFHYGPIGPSNGTTPGSIVKTSGASVGIEDAPAVNGAQTTYLNAVAFREYGGRFDSTTQSRRLTSVWPPPGFPGQAFVFSGTRLRRISDWGDGDADLTQLETGVPEYIRLDQRRFVTFGDVIRILRHDATRNVPFDYGVGRHGFHGDVNHDGRFYFSTRNYNNTADSTDPSTGAIVRYKVLYPIKDRNYQLPFPNDNSFSGFLFDADAFDASLIMLYLAAKLPVLPWLPDTLPYFSGKVSMKGDANDIALTQGETYADNRIEIPVTFNGYLSGALGVSMNAAEGTRIVEVRATPMSSDRWVEAVAGEDRVALAAAGNFDPNEVIATIVVEPNSRGEVVFTDVKVGEEMKGTRKLTISNEAGALNLTQNVPHPFSPNSITSMEYTLPVDGKVSIQVFDVLGREVATLVNTSAKAGSYVAEWNGLDAAGEPVASGIYYCRIEAAGQARTIAMQVGK